MTELFKKLLYKKLISKNIKNGTLIKGKIIEINKHNVIVDAKLKSESSINIEEFKNSKGKIKIKLNEKIEVYIEAIEGGYGETILSREKAIKHKAWIYLEKIYSSSKNITGLITNRVKGGFTVNLKGIKSFLPGSLVDIKPIKDPSLLENKELEFKIIKLDKKKNNIVVSRKAVILNESNNEREELISNIFEGAILKGIIKNITDYGAFIDLGGLDGLLHITDIAWRRVRHPNEILNVGEQIKTKVIKFDKEKIRVSLGLKQLTPDPWIAIEQKYPVNSKIKGKITNLTDYGCFIEIEEGIEGLAHISEIDWVNKNINPFKIFNIGDEIEAIILNINQEKRRISLGVKQCKPNPWKIFSQEYKKGDKVTGKIKSITDFGIFIELKGHIDGLIHTSDISWTPSNTKKLKKTYNKGDKITTRILHIEPKRERISLGIKQLKKDPLDKYIKLYNNNNILKIKPKHIHIHNNSIKINLKEGIHTEIQNINSVPKNFLKNIKSSNILKTKIISIDKKHRIINLIIIVKQKKQNLTGKNCFNTMREAFKTAKNE